MNDAKLIEVTADHIARGKHNDSTSCPIALAMNEKFGVPVCAFGHSCLIDDRYRYRLPLSAQLFVSAFDGHMPVSPFSFELGEYITC